MPACRRLSFTLLARLTLGCALTAHAADGMGLAAPGAPGTLSHFNLARKDCLGTARNSTSKIWYTVANGVLSDVYAPTIDTNNVETLQLIVTDGATFTDLQSRDTTYTVDTDLTGMVCTVTSEAKSGEYRIITTYLADPLRNSIVMRVKYMPLAPRAEKYQLYVRLDATVGGNGGGGSGNGGADTAVVDVSTGGPVPVSFDTKTATNAFNRDYAVPSYLALRADRPFTQVSSGFVGTASDGLAQLDLARRLVTAYAAAVDGNVEQTAAIDLGGERAFILALGFGTTQAEAVATAGATLARSFASLRIAYEAGWLRYDAKLRRPSLDLPGLTAEEKAAVVRHYYAAANVVKASEDKTFPGAIVAALASPWGQSVSAGDPALTYFGSYREIFARDLYEAWTGLFAAGELATARDAVRFLFLRQQLPDGGFPRNSLINGKTAPDSFGIQLDEVAYPILMAEQSGLGNDAALWPHIAAAANYLVSHGPSFGVERWEEQSGYSPSTIAAEIAGLVAAARIAERRNEPAAARLWLATADAYQRRIKSWTVTANGPLSALPYFIRLSKTGDPNAAISYNMGNGGPTLDQRTVIDAGFLELVRLGALPANDPDVLHSLTVVDQVIKRETARGTGWLRYNGDGYGDCVLGSGNACDVTGAPWAPTGRGTGHIWPVLAAERAGLALVSGSAMEAAALLVGMVAQSSGAGLVPEQVWDAADLAPSPFGADPTTASIGFVNGLPDGSASPLTWGAGAFVRMTANLSAGRLIEQPTFTVNRYVTRTQRETALAVTSPGDQTAAGESVVVTGTAAPGATVDVAAVGIEANGATTFATQVAADDGTFALTVATAHGLNVIAVAATAPDGATAQTTRTVLNDTVDGTLLFDIADPSGDDNGPGNYAYPTAGDFHPGAYDLQRFQIYDAGSAVVFRVLVRDLTPTFGSPLGAQLIDVYVRQPGVDPSETSTAASFAETPRDPTFPRRNYVIAPADAWSRLIEVQGFGQRFINAHGATVGTVSIKANAISRFITFAVDKAALGGTPASGWAFTVTLTGQDGFSGDQARAFAATPLAFTFGVCTASSADPRCITDPSAIFTTIPKTMDVLTPPGVSQTDELDYTRHTPVVLRAVVMP